MAVGRYGSRSSGKADKVPMPALPPTITRRPPAASQCRSASSWRLESWLLSTSCQTSRSTTLQPSARSGRSAMVKGTIAGAAPAELLGRSICEIRACGRSASTPTTSWVASWMR